MKGIYFILCNIILLVSCSSDVVENQNTKGLVFSDLKSDFVLKDINNYGCEKIDKSVLAHVLKTGVIATDREIHDYYSYTGCTIQGNVTTNGKNIGFIFDYGGIFYLKNGQTIACGEKCCVKGFQHCSWDKNGLKG